MNRKWHNFVLTTEKNQRINFVINKRNITLIIKYNSYNDTWVFNIFEDLKPLLCGGTLTTGFDILTGYNLLNQFEYLGLGELYLWTIDFNKDDNYPKLKTIKNFMFTWVF